MTPDMRAVVTALRGKRLPMHDEKACQEAIAKVLREERFQFTREAKVTGGIIDFKVAMETGIEVKLKGSIADIRRQVNKYAADPALTGIVLVTARPVGLTDLMRGKPVTEFDLSRAWL